MNNGLNEYEVSLCEAILEAAHYLSGEDELEIDHLGDGWYAMRYVNGDGVYSLSANDYDNKPLIADETIKKHCVDVQKVFNMCGVAYWDR